jgi:hypothetical protein
MIFKNIFCFTDSIVALSWIISEPFKWNTFVANRVSKIQEVVHQVNWYHVQGVENPADVLSRGTSPSELVGNSLYWNGPPWVKQPTDQWELSRYVPSSDSVPEERKKATLHSVSKEKVFRYFARSRGQNFIFEKTDASSRDGFKILSPSSYWPMYRE